jgi:hypothetical protein
VASDSKLEFQPPDTMLPLLRLDSRQNDIVHCAGLRYRHARSGVRG